MIHFKSLKIRNLLQFGNSFFEFDFEEGIYRISGKNGSGKSTIPTDALSFALFGKPYRKIKINQLINSINKKSLEVVLTLSKGADEYRIERGLRPDYFRVFKNDIIVPVSSSKKGYQQILEEDILQFNENIFHQILVKSLTRNGSFMDATKQVKRNVVENLLDIELFSIITKNIKSKIDVLDFSTQTTKKEIESFSLLIEQELANLEQLKIIKKKMDDESKVKIDEINTEIQELTDEVEKYSLALQKINEKKAQRTEKLQFIEKVKKYIKMATDSQTDLIAKIKLSESKINLFKDSCGDCPKISELLKSEDVEGIKETLTLVNQKIETYREQITLKEAEIRKLDEIIANERMITSTISSNKNKIASLRNSVKTESAKEIVIDETKLKSYYNDKQLAEDKYNETCKLKKHYQVLKSLYSDEGIKAFIIKKYLPTINKLMSTYLRKFNSDIIFNFDQDFNEIVLSKYREDFSYFSFSEGQKKRIDLAVLFAFIMFSLHKNRKANTNLLVLDEITSGLDAEGQNLLHEVLKEHKEAQKKCIITISHSDSIDIDNFDHIFEATIEKGFSKLTKVNM